RGNWPVLSGFFNNTSPDRRNAPPPGGDDNSGFRIVVRAGRQLNDFGEILSLIKSPQYGSPVGIPVNPAWGGLL
ncbi:hypothetical protein, partial [Klebsiella michiganensis]|uniref:hypothetical protein n=1 Tax=Klebsiella michiganensis TaxID=1134687 RepID=UPI001CA31532